MPIGFQYQPDGSLFASGANNMMQAQSQGFAQALAARNSAQQGIDEQQQNQLQAQRLQMAQQMALQRQQGATPTSGISYTGNGSGPFAQSIAQKKLLRASIVGDDAQLPDEITQAENSPNVSPQVYQQALQGYQARTVKTAATQAQIESKKDIVRAAASAGQIDPSDIETIKQFALDPKSSPENLRLALTNSFQKKRTNEAVTQQQTQKHSMFQQAASAISPDDSPTIAGMLDDPKVTTEDLSRAILESNGRAKQSAQQALSRQISASQKTAADSMKQAEQIQKANSEYDFNAGDAQFTANGKTDAEGLAAYKQWQAATTKAAQMQDRVEKLSQVGAGPAAPQMGQQQQQVPQQQDGKGPIPIDMAHQLLQAANGDKDAARRMAAQMGYSF